MEYIVAVWDMAGLAIVGVVKLATGPADVAGVLVGRKVVELATGPADVAVVAEAPVSR
jgi:hypothetical protein